MSIELSLEDVKRVALQYGFQFEVILAHIYSIAFCIFDYSECIDLFMDCRRKAPLRQPTLQIRDQ